MADKKVSPIAAIDHLLIRWFQSQTHVFIRLRSRVTAMKQGVRLPSNRTILFANCAEYRTPSHTLQLYQSFYPQKSFILQPHKPYTIILAKQRVGLVWPRLFETRESLPWVDYCLYYWQHAAPLSTANINPKPSGKSIFLWHHLQPPAIMNAAFHPKALLGLVRRYPANLRKLAHLIVESPNGVDLDQLPSLIFSYLNMSLFMSMKGHKISHHPSLLLAFHEMRGSEQWLPTCIDQIVQLRYYGYGQLHPQLPPPSDSKVRAEKKRLAKRLDMLAKCVVEEQAEERKAMSQKRRAKCVLGCLPAGLADAFWERNEERLYEELAKLEDDEAEWCMREAGKAGLWVP